MIKKRLIQFTQNNTSLFSNFANLGFIQVSNVLLQIILFPIIIRKVGLESFGNIVVSNTIAGFICLFINYSTNLSGIKEIAINKKDKKGLEYIFFNIYYTRFALFLIASLIPITFYIFKYNQLQYLLFATPIILAEVINPLFYFNGIEKLTLYNTANLLAKISSAIFILFFISPDTPTWYVNFYLGLGNLIFYSLLLFFAIRKNNLQPPTINYAAIRQLIKDNFYLVCNNLAVHLQQSFFLIMLPFVTTPLIVSAYSLADKVVSSFRILLVAFSSALYPQSAILYETKRNHWPLFKKKTNTFLFLSFTMVAILIYFFNKRIVHLLIGQNDEISAHYILSIAWVPFLAAMNSMNIIELLIKNQYRFIFYNSLCLLTFVVITASLFIYANQINYFGYYFLLVEGAAIPISLYFIRRKKIT